MSLLKTATIIGTVTAALWGVYWLYTTFGPGATATASVLPAASSVPAPVTVGTGSALSYSPGAVPAPPPASVLAALGDSTGLSFAANDLGAIRAPTVASTTPHNWVTKV